MNVLTDLNLKAVVRHVIVDDVFPALDKFTAEWKTFLEIDNKVWAFAKEKITAWLDKVLPALTFSQSFGGFTLGGATISPHAIGAFNLKELVKTIVVTFLFPIVDNAVKAFHTPFELDDKAWAILRAKIEEALNKVDADKLLANMDESQGHASSPSPLATDDAERAESVTKQFASTSDEGKSEDEPEDDDSEDESEDDTSKKKPTPKKRGHR